jgi:peptidyl-prolyl cis-trans isomerase SurA
MKSKLIIAGLFMAGIFVVSTSSARAQEGEPVVIDEVIAQVNDGVITLSQVKSEMAERVQTLKQNGMPEQQAIAEVEKHKAELIATLINEQLLLQKGKELDFSDRIEVEVNKRMLQVAIDNKIPSIEKLEQAMRESGVDPVVTRQTMRAEMMKQAVLESEVDAKIFYGHSMEELRKYFDSHREKFIKRESVELSEIFLSLAGKPEAEVKARANQLVAQIRGGADFKTLATAYSERGQQAGGKVGLFEITSLRPDLAAAIKNVNAGGVSEPLKTDEGYQVLRVDARNPGATTPVFNENRVREEMTKEILPKEREKYLQNLRNDAYVKVADSYRAAVEPLLNIVPPAAATKNPKKDKKEKNDKP